MFKNPSEGRLTQVGQCLDRGAQSSGPQGRAQPQLLLLQVEQELPQRVLESEQLWWHATLCAHKTYTWGCWGKYTYNGTCTGQSGVGHCL